MTKGRAIVAWIAAVIAIGALSNAGHQTPARGKDVIACRNPDTWRKALAMGNSGDQKGMIDYLDRQFLLDECKMMPSNSPVELKFLNLSCIRASKLSEPCRWTPE